MRDRPKPPHDWRWVVGGIGKVLIVTGLLMFAFVAYQLWGTGIEYAQAQSRLDNELEELLAGPPPTSTLAPAPATTVEGEPPATTVPAPAPAPVPAFEPGDAIARIEIPSIGLDSVVVAGVDPDDLKTGPGHYEGTPMPGQLGNSAIAGHRTTYGQPFYRLDEVEVGAEIVLTTVQGRFVYRATGSEVVEPGASQVVATTDPTVATLTLTTCTPRYTANERLVVYADLDVEASARPRPAVLELRRRQRRRTSATTVPATTVDGGDNPADDGRETRRSPPVAVTGRRASPRNRPMRSPTAGSATGRRGPRS